MGFQDLSRRVVVATISIVVVAFLIVFSMVKGVEIGLIVLVALLAAIGIWEYANMLKLKKFSPPTLFMQVFGIAIVLAFSQIPFIRTFSHIPLIVFCIGGFTLFLLYFRQIQNSIGNVATGFFGVCYVAVPLGLALRVLYLSPFGGDGRLWLTYLIAVTKMTDIGAYFGGKLWGKRKLAPMLSPGKTVNGLISGVVAALILSLVFYLISLAIHKHFFQITLFQAIWLPIFLAVMGQMGDLAESLFKRDAGVKDSNRFPGLGVLDMVDSLLFTIPIMYFFLYT